MENSSDTITQVQNEVTVLRAKNQLQNSCRKFCTALPDRIVNTITANTATLGVRIGGVPESKATTDNARMQEDLETVDNILAFLEIEDRKWTKASGIRKYYLIQHCSSTPKVQKLVPEVDIKAEKLP